MHTLLITIFTLMTLLLAGCGPSEAEIQAMQAKKDAELKAQQDAAFLAVMKATNQKYIDSNARFTAKPQK